MMESTRSYLLRPAFTCYSDDLVVSARAIENLEVRQIRRKTFGAEFVNDGT